MNKLKILENMDLGNSVAEYDENLSNYFIRTSNVSELLKDKYDIIRGAKGSGKSAMLQGIISKQNEFRELDNVILVKAINHRGDPIFKRAFKNINNEVDEDNLIDAWKTYIINIIWDEVVNISDEYCEIERYLIENNLIHKDKTKINKLLFALNRFIPKKAKATFILPEGLQVATEIDLQENTCEDTQNEIDFNYIFESLNYLLADKDARLWVLLDRLDDAFPTNSNNSVIALKCLFLAYKDIAGLQALKLKIFIRDDIYNIVTSHNGFVSLTHIKSNSMPSIHWNKDKLLQLFIQRLLYNNDVYEYLKVQGVDIKNIQENINKLLRIIFREQIDIGENNPDTFGWIVNHITDGNRIFTPRDFIELIDTARKFQLDEWEINDKSNDCKYLIGANAVKKAYNEISINKIEAQLFAEYPELKNYILKFKHGKAEHNEITLANMFGKRKWKTVVPKLVEIGFIEELSKSWKIPFIYRPGIKVSQGKAF